MFTSITNSVGFSSFEPARKCASLPIPYERRCVISSYKHMSLPSKPKHANARDLSAFGYLTRVCVYDNINMTL